jgi:hypothetical protein
MTTSSPSSSPLLAADRIGPASITILDDDPAILDLLRMR